ncbi:Conserved oligomeric Golgi complex subunit 2 [Trichoplax sp. H2]|nr:Conserved oligomeric Golgi complex subunit 2 [Trichoplax sp. H2]|eukprot:RDD44303.1 Conserved oligomeric Golgi complex subunit 2 [Trichoplax sp. H2]
MAATLDINDNTSAMILGNGITIADEEEMELEKGEILKDGTDLARKQSLLPSGPSTLCFVTEDFVSEEFNVDGFITSCRSSVSPEVLRNDLKTYFDILKSSMVELINKDYADFVNLSTNLVGLDKAISNISAPLEQIKTEVGSVKDCIGQAMNGINRRLKKRTELREKKARLQRLLNISDSVDKIEKLLQISSTSPQNMMSASSEEENYGHLIERVAIEFNQLLFNLNQSKGLPFVQKIQLRIDSISKTLKSSLDRLFEEAVGGGQTDSLARCLRTYAAIDKVQEAETLFRNMVVKPRTNEIIKSEMLDVVALQTMYQKIIDFIPIHCGLLLELTAETTLSDIGRGSITTSGSKIRGYDFLVHSVFPEVVSSIEVRLPLIFAPGNPDIFHQKFTATLEFIAKFEYHCCSQSSILRLRDHSSYKQFMSKWNLPVYFQIRFKDIGELTESAYTNPFITVSDKICRLNVTNTLWYCVSRCWSDDVFLLNLTHLFWKLTMQLLSRFSYWLTNVKENLPNFGLEDRSKGSSIDTNKSRESKRDVVLSDTAHVINLIGDIDILIPMVKKLYKDTIIPHVKELQSDNFVLLDESIKEACDNVVLHLPKFESHVITQVADSCKQHLDAANSVPRQYRRTNREMPGKCSTYVHAIFIPLKSFISERSDHISSNKCKDWVTRILQIVADKYFNIINDILTSVEKTRDSLMRLKKNIAAAASGSSTSVSDEDKIRLQLQLDVLEFANEIEKFSASSRSLPACQQLIALVQSTNKSNINEI